MSLQNCILFFSLFFFSSCSWNWNQREMEEDMNKEIEQSLVSNVEKQLDEDRSAAFAVTTAPPLIETATAPIEKAKSESKKLQTKKVKADISRKEAPKMEETLPENYPPQFVEMDKKSKPIWDSFNPLVMVGESSTYDINYMGMVVGKVFMTTKPNVFIGGREAFHFVAKLKSAPFYSYLYVLDDVIESFVDKETFRPLKFSLLQRESKKSIDDIEFFDHEKRLSYFRYKRTRKGKTETKSVDLPIPKYIQDAFSCMVFVRGLPLKNGDRYEFPMATKDKITILDMTVLGRERYEGTLGRKEAIRIQAITRYSGDLVEKGNMEIWLSNDENKIFLKFKAKTKIGALEGEITSYKVGNES